MIVDVSKKILIVGLGLMGGSYARVLKRFGFHISAITRDQSSIDYALKENIIDEGSTKPDEKIIGQADLVIFALYPHDFVEWIETNQNLFKSGTLITDVTGVKGSVVYKIQGCFGLMLSLSQHILWQAVSFPVLKTVRIKYLQGQTISLSRLKKIRRKQLRPVRN